MALPPGPRRVQDVAARIRHTLNGRRGSSPDTSAGAGGNVRLRELYGRSEPDAELAALTLLSLVRGAERPFIDNDDSVRDSSCGHPAGIKRRSVRSRRALCRSRHHAAWYGPIRPRPVVRGACSPVPVFSKNTSTKSFTD